MADRPILKFAARAITGGMPSVNLTSGHAQNLGQVVNLFGAAAGEASRRADQLAVQKAQEEGALAGLGGSPNLEKGVGLQARAFNDAAKSNMMLKLDLDTKSHIDQMALDNPQDPDAFRLGAESFSNEAARMIENIDPVLAGLYNLKSQAAIDSSAMKIQANKNVKVGQEREGNLAATIDRYDTDRAGRLNDLVSGDPDAASLAATQLVADAGLLVAAMSQEKLPDGTPLRTPEQITNFMAKERDFLASETFKAMVEQADTEEDVRGLIDELNSNTLELDVLNLTKTGPQLDRSVPLDVFGISEVNTLENYGLANIAGRRAFNEKADLTARTAQNRFAKEVAIPKMRETGRAPEVDTSLMTEAQVVSFENGIASARIEYESNLFMDGKYPDQRARVMVALSEGGLDTVESRERMEALVEADRRMMEAMATDSAKEIYRMNPDFTQLDDSEVRNEALRNEQLRHGVLESDVRYSTNSQLESVAQALSVATNGEELIGVVKGLDALFGNQTNFVLNEAAKAHKINPNVGILSNIMLRSETGELNPDAVTLAKLLMPDPVTKEMIPNATMAKQLDDKSKVTAIDERIRAEMDLFFNSVAHVPGNEGTMAQYRNAVERMSYHYARNQNADEAVNRSLAAILPYKYSGDVRIPENVHTQRMAVAVQFKVPLVDLAVERGAIPVDASIFESTDPEKAATDYFDTTRRIGTVVTSEAEDGVSILDEHMVPLVDPSGNPIVITWGELHEMGPVPVGGSNPAFINIGAGGGVDFTFEPTGGPSLLDKLLDNAKNYKRGDAFRAPEDRRGGKPSAFQKKTEFETTESPKVDLPLREQVSDRAPVGKAGRISQSGIDFIKEFEGFSAKAEFILDEEKLTGGFGSVREGLVEGEEITTERGEQFLREDLEEHEGHVKRLVPNWRKLEQNEFDALVSLTFNAGPGNVGKSNALAALNEALSGDERNVKKIEEFLLEAFDAKRGFVRAGGVIKRGLVRRRAAERELFLGNR